MHLKYFHGEGDMKICIALTLKFTVKCLHEAESETLGKIDHQICADPLSLPSYMLPLLSDCPISTPHSIPSLDGYVHLQVSAKMSTLQNQHPQTTFSIEVPLFSITVPC